MVPDDLKSARVVPLYKKNDDTLLNNYRPISLLISISKVFEKVVFLQLHKYFKDNNLFYKSQYGFLPEHSTELSCLELIDKITLDLDNKQTPVAIFMDLSKAFDTLNHDILLSKLSYYGISDIALIWFRSYLTNRSQYVELNNTCSSTATISTGVPQGSILGPLLFLIYINDIPNSSTTFSFVLYADDTTLYSSIHYMFPSSSNKYISKTLNDELTKVHNWLCVNKLSLNIEKTKYMIFKLAGKRTPTLNLNIENTKLEQVREFTFLGIILDEHLNWHAHVNHISTKISKNCGILNSMKKYLPFTTLKTLYFSMINPYLQYGILAWGFNNTRLQKLQKRAIRIITNSKYNSHTEPLFKKTNILKFEDMFNVSCTKFLYKLLQQNLPAYFRGFDLIPQNSVHSHLTRENIRYRLNVTRTKKAQNSIRNVLPKFANHLPGCIYNKLFTHSLQGVSRFSKTYYLDNYSYTCSIDNCYICRGA